MRIQREQRRWVLLAVALNVVVLLLCLFWLGPRPRTNDDTIIHMVTSGVYGSKSAKLGHINLLFGQILMALSSLVPVCNWVHVLEIMFIFLSFTALSAVFLLRMPRTLGLALVSIALFVFAPRFYLNLHYTRCVILFAAAGFYLFFDGVQHKNRFCLAAGGFLAAFASIIRFGAFLSGIAFAGIIGVTLLFSGRPVRGIADFFRKNARLIVWTIALFCVIFGLLAYDMWMVARDDELAETRRYNDARRMLVDYELPGYDENREAFLQLGMTRNDREMVALWGQADLEIYPVEVLEGMVELQSPRSVQQSVQETLTLMTTSQDYLNVYTFVGLLLPLVLVFLTRGASRIGILLMPVCYLALSFLLGFIGRTTAWVTEGNAAAAFLGACLCVTKESVRPMPRVTEKVLPIALAAVCAAGSGYTLYHYGVGFGYFTVPDEALAYYETIRQDENNLYLHDITLVYPHDRIVMPFRAIPPGLFHNLYFLGGWDTGSPARNAVLERYGVTSPYRALVENENVYLLDHYSAGVQNKLTVIREHVCNLVRYAMVTSPCGHTAYTFTDGAVPREGYLEQLDLTEGSITIDERDHSYYAVALRLDRALPEETVLYVAFYENGSEQTTLQYRVPASGDLVRFSLPTFDLPFIPETLEAVVYLEADGVPVCSDRLALHYE